MGGEQEVRVFLLSWGMKNGIMGLVGPILSHAKWLFDQNIFWFDVCDSTSVVGKD